MGIISCGNIDELIPFLGLKAKFSDLFSEDGVEHAVVSEDHSSSGLGCIERDLKVTHADLIAELQSKFNDDAEFARCSCERLCQRKQVCRVNFSLDKYKTDACTGKEQKPLFCRMVSLNNSYTFVSTADHF